jgi:hypothetical protein
MGYGTTRPLERVLASCGLLTSAELEFVAADDVPNGGVLCALPALLAEGLLRHTHLLPPAARILPFGVDLFGLTTSCVAESSVSPFVWHADPGQ